MRKKRGETDAQHAERQRLFFEKVDRRVSQRNELISETLIDECVTAELAENKNFENFKTFSGDQRYEF